MYYDGNLSILLTRKFYHFDETAENTSFIEVFLFRIIQIGILLGKSAENKIVVFLFEIIYNCDTLLSAKYDRGENSREDH